MSVATTEGDVDAVPTRDRSAATEAMIVCELAPGMFEVFSGECGRYVVDLESGACTCEDWHYRQPDGGCKHRRRCEMTIGERAIPDVQGVDSTLPRQRRRWAR